MSSQAGGLLRAYLPGQSVPERRFRVRHKVHSPAYATKEQNLSFILSHLNEIVDIGEDGMCFQNSSPLEPTKNLKVCLDLSETKTHIEADGEIVWSSDSGRTGVRFQKISGESLQQLRQWLFINNIIACVNHSSSTVHAKTDASAAAESSEYSAPLLPDHTSMLIAVAAISREVAALGQHVDAALQLITDRALALTRSTGAAIAVSDVENMICRASSGSDAPPVGAILQADSGFSGECVRTGQLLLCEDSEKDPRVDQQSCKALGVRSMIAAPVRANGLVIGLLEVFSPQARIFTDSDKAILQRLAEIVAQAIARSSLQWVGEATNALSETPEAEDVGKDSRLSRLLIALAVIFAVGLMALVVIPQVRSKTVDSHPVAANANRNVPVVHTPLGFDGLRRLAEQGDAASQFALGARYATGEDVKQDYFEAARWFLLAADQGHAGAQSVLVAYYWDGTGVPKDLSKAYFWAILARANQDEPSRVRAAELGSRLSYGERDAIQQQADDWLKQHSFSTASSSSEPLTP